MPRYTQCRSPALPKLDRVAIRSTEIDPKISLQQLQSILARIFNLVFDIPTFQRP